MSAPSVEPAFDSEEECVRVPEPGRCAIAPPDVDWLIPRVRDGERFPENEGVNRFAWYNRHEPTSTRHGKGAREGNAAPYFAARQPGARGHIDPAGTLYNDPAVRYGNKVFETTFNGQAVLVNDILAMNPPNRRGDDEEFARSRYATEGNYRLFRAQGYDASRAKPARSESIVSQAEWGELYRPEATPHAVYLDWIQRRMIYANAATSHLRNDVGIIAQSERANLGTPYEQRKREEAYALARPAPVIQRTAGLEANPLLGPAYDPTRGAPADAEKTTRFAPPEVEPRPGPAPSRIGARNDQHAIVSWASVVPRAQTEVVHRQDATRRERSLAASAAVAGAAAAPAAAREIVHRQDARRSDPSAPAILAWNAVVPRVANESGPHRQDASTAIHTWKPAQYAAATVTARAEGERPQREGPKADFRERATVAAGAAIAGRAATDTRRPWRGMATSFRMPNHSGEPTTNLAQRLRQYTRREEPAIGTSIEQTVTPVAGRALTTAHHPWELMVK